MHLVVPFVAFEPTCCFPRTRLANSCEFQLDTRLSARDVCAWVGGGGVATRRCRRLRNILSREQPKLVSVHEDNVQLTDFVVNLLYLATHHSVIITSVDSIVEFRVRDIFTPYMVFLQKSRQESVTTIESKLYKSLG